MLYEYECLTCGKVFEVYQPIHDDKLFTYKCEECGSMQPVRRIIGAPHFILKGCGWAKDGYSNDNKNSK